MIVFSFICKYLSLGLFYYRCVYYPLTVFRLKSEQILIKLANTRKWQGRLKAITFRSGGCTTYKQTDSQTRERTRFTLVLRSMTKGYRRSTTSIGARSPIVAARLISTPLTSLDHGTDLVAAPLVVLLLQRHTAAIAKISSVITICAMITTTTAATGTDVDCDSPSDKTPMMPIRT